MNVNNIVEWTLEITGEMVGNILKGMTNVPETFILLCLWIGLSGAFLVGCHFLLTLPMRRAERTRLFLDLIEASIKQGRPIEESLISVSQTRDMSMGVRFHLLAAWIEQNLTLGDALAKVPKFLPPQITTMLIAGQRVGDLSKVLPACRQLLKDAVSQTRAAISYLVIITLVLTPMGIWILGIMRLIVLPKFIEIFQGSLGDGAPLPARLIYLSDHYGAFCAVQIAAIVFVWFAAILYMAGPRIADRIPFLSRLPWRQKRLQRDFSTMLAILLDSGVPEPAAVAMAADCTSNRAFRRRAARVVERLQQGKKLPQAIEALDGSGELGWRLTNAFHGGGFLRALTGWHESLDAKAFQEEQAAAHSVTSAFVLWSGLFVGAIVLSVFGMLISLINAAVLW